MPKLIYGVDPSGVVTAPMVRDAMVECFYLAHCADTGLDDTSADKKDLRDYCRALVEDAFARAKADFDNPTKEGLLRVVEELKKFALNFRAPEVVNKHADEIRSLAEKIK